MFRLAVVAASILVALSNVNAVEFPGFGELPSGWKESSDSLDASKVVNLRIALVPKDAQKLEQTLIEISTPGKPSFRKWLKQNQITEIVGRSDSEIKRVTDWLESSGAKVKSVHPHKDWVVASTTVAQAEKLFDCKLGSYVNAKTSSSKIAAKGSYKIPDNMADLVHFVAGMTTFSYARWEAIESTAEIPASITPQTIYDNYGVPSSGSHGSKVGSQAVVEFGKTADFNEDDTQTFFDLYQSDLKGEVCGVVYGENDGEGRPSVEANLDVQYIMAAGPWVNTTDYKITSSNDIEDMYLDYTMIVNSQIEPPLVHSISYGAYGGSYDNTTDQQMSYELQKMGIAGVSVLLASGDNGVGCNTRGTSQEFDYPSTPYITMVGATYIDSVTKKEVGATLSSGGFSKDFMQASWQADAVNAYFASGATMPSEDFYKPGRAYPDVAAYGENVQVVASGKSKAVSGTSCSAPIFAGVVATLNDELIAAGKSPLGFLNPWLYANPDMFTDITSGSNPYQKCDGFEAAVGWDPVTGLGTPIYSKMRTAAFVNV